MNAGWHGHWYTMAPWALGTLRGWMPSRLEPFTALVEDPRFGSLTLRGLLKHAAGSKRCVVLVHGLGGSAHSPYLWRARKVASERGYSSLAIHLRGADRSGEDLYHAGLSADLHAALAAHSLAAFEELYLIGYSLGGHVALRAACEAGDERLRAVAALCSPLDLAAARTCFDRDAALPYRKNVIAGMRSIAIAANRHRQLGFDLPAIARARTLAEMDSLTVVPRYGFEDLADYDTSVSVAPLLDQLRVPALYVGSDRDPMVSKAAVEPYARSKRLEVRFGRGGHVGFPGGVAMERAVFDWFDEQHPHG